MTLESKARQTNLRRLEWFVMIAGIAVLMTVFMRRAERLEAEMERTAYDLTVRNLRTELVMFETGHRISGRMADLATAAAGNPVGVVFMEPTGYAGAFDGDRPERVRPGQWYYDNKGRYLVYRVNHSRYFRSELPGVERIRLRVELKYRDQNGNGGYDAEDQVLGIAMTAADRHEWLQTAKD